MSGVIKGERERPCWNCGKSTKNISVTFETPMCSGKCDDEKFKEYVEACKE